MNRTRNTILAALSLIPLFLQPVVAQSLQAGLYAEMNTARGTLRLGSRTSSLHWAMIS